MPRERASRRIGHAAEARRHGKASVVGFLRQQDRSSLAGCRNLASKRAVRIACDRKVMNIAHELFCKIERGHAFRAVARAAKGNEQRRLVGREVEIWRARRDRWWGSPRPGTAVACEIGARHSPMKEDVPAPARITRVAARSSNGRKKRAPARPCVATSRIVRLAQHRRLLRDLASRPERARAPAAHLHRGRA